ncbi:MAG: NotI family restriction endonuclease [Blastocatellia bacterium]
MPKHPLAEVFGFPIANQTKEARRYREHRLCPFNNRVPNCTKDKVTDPLGVCSVYDEDVVAITCPVRFREDWIIADQAAAFFFPKHTAWTSLTDVRLNDKYERSTGNIDVVLVAYDDQGRVVDFGAIEIQAITIAEQSLRKQLAPQILLRGAIFKAWRKKQAIVLQRSFYETLPELPAVGPGEADMAWLICDLGYASSENRHIISPHEIRYSGFDAALKLLAPYNMKIPESSSEQSFVNYLYDKMEEAAVI